MSKKARGSKGNKFNISVTGRHLDVTESMKQHAREKLEKIKKYFPRVIDIHVVMDIQKFNHKVEVILQANHINIQAKEVTKDMYISIDKVVAKLDRQLKKYKNKIQEHRHREAKTTLLPLDIISFKKKSDDFEPKVVTSEKFSAKPMFLDEAMVQVKLSRDNFLVFTNAENEKINVIYKRKDGNFGLIEP